MTARTLPAPTPRELPRLLADNTATKTHAMYIWPAECLAPLPSQLISAPEWSHQSLYSLTPFSRVQFFWTGAM